MRVWASLRNATAETVPRLLVTGSQINTLLAEGRSMAAVGEQTSRRSGRTSWLHLPKRWRLVREKGDLLGCVTKGGVFNCRASQLSSRVGDASRYSDGTVSAMFSAHAESILVVAPEQGGGFDPFWRLAACGVQVASRGEGPARGIV
jgi:hypothetical protein